MEDKHNFLNSSEKSHTLYFSQGLSYKGLQPYLDGTYVLPQKIYELTNLLFSASSIYQIIELEDSNLKIRDLFTSSFLDSFWLSLLKNREKLFRYFQLENDNDLNIYVNTMIAQKGMQPYDLLAGLALFQKAQVREDEKELLTILKKSAENYHSFHSATHFFTIKLKNILETEEEYNRNKTIDEISIWYLDAAKIHGSPAYANLALNYYYLFLKYKEIQYAQKAYIFSEIAVKINNLCKESVHNAYFGNGFCITNKEGINSVSELHDKIIYIPIDKDKSTIQDYVSSYLSLIKKSSPCTKINFI